MSRRKRGRDIHGIVLLDKPAGLTSNQALQQVRRLFDARKAGHTGNLDPFATGMLPICLGEASKTAAFMLDADKAYSAQMVLGSATATGDVEGEVVATASVPVCSAGELEQVLQGFVGEISQIPPMYSALKHRGRPLYELARQGIEVERKARTVRIDRLALLNWRAPRLEFEVRCSKGTYVRTLAEDIGRALGSCAHLDTLRRLYVQPFDPGQMVTLAHLEEAERSGRLAAFLLPVDAGLAGWPRLVLEEPAAAGFAHGNPQKVEAAEPANIRVYGPSGQILGLGELGGDGLLRPRRVFNLGQAGPQSAEQA
jgi:tRNA pseudouridine55 synthase